MNYIILIKHTFFKIEDEDAESLRIIKYNDYNYNALIFYNVKHLFKLVFLMLLRNFLTENV